MKNISAVFASLVICFLATTVFAEDPPFMNEVKDVNLRMSLRTYGKTNVTQVANLVLNANRISDIRPLKNLTQLTRLEMYNNLISDVSALSNLANLNKLYLGKNRIKDLSPLRYLKNLSVLDIHKNEVKDLSPLGDLPALKELDIRGLALNLDSFDGWAFENTLQIYDQSGKFVEIATNEKDKWAIHQGRVEAAVRTSPIMPALDTNASPMASETNTNR
jgi:hypothetical protein